MRTISSDDTVKTTPATKKNTMSKLETFSTTLVDGREITIREMTGRDLIYMEKDLTKAGDVEKGMRIIERLIVGDDKITYDEILASVSRTSVNSATWLPRPTALTKKTQTNS